MKVFLNIITYIFQPLLMPFYCVILLLRLDFFRDFSTLFHFLTIAGTLLFTTILPAIPIIYMVEKGKIKDVFISKRQERTIPYIISIICYTLWIVFLFKYLRLPDEIIILAIGSLISLVGMVTINLKWKISAHTAGIGGLLGSIISVSYLMEINPRFLIISIIIISALVAISRIVLKAHTPAQVTGGFFWGLACCTIPIFIFLFFDNWL